MGLRPPLARPPRKLPMPGLIEKLIRQSVSTGVLALARYNRNRMPEPKRPHPYLSGLFAPMPQELTLTDLPVQGTIPPDLDGRYLRIGPNPIAPPQAAVHHWFVGDGMVHGLRLQGGRARWYRNRWVRSSAVSQALGEAPAPGPRRFSDTVNTNVMALGGRLYALVEAGGHPVVLGEELQTIAHDPFGGSLRGAFSAHPHVCPATGEAHAVCYEAVEHDTVHHVVLGRDGRVRRREPIAVRGGPGIHDCMITERFVLVLDLPVTFSMGTLAAGYAFPYRWNPQHRARVGVLGRDAPGSSIVWCDVDPCYVFHPANAFENADGTITLDVVAHASMFAFSHAGPDAPRTALERWTVDPASRRVARAVLDPQRQEFPRIDERRTGRPYRHLYSAAFARDGAHDFRAEPRLFKHDLQAGTRAVHDFGPGRHVGEFVFQPRHADAAEDEGWLMGLVVDEGAGTTDFVILDAQDFGAPPMATVTLPHVVPAGFHGNWVPDGMG
jgi:carotenoid cleavage dioxygenase